jgi:hypothetical protein
LWSKHQICSFVCFLYGAARARIENARRNAFWETFRGFANHYCTAICALFALISEKSTASKYFGTKGVCTRYVAVDGLGGLEAIQFCRLILLSFYKFPLCTRVIICTLRSSLVDCPLENPWS